MQLDTNQLANAIASDERALSLYQRLAAEDPTDERYRFGVVRVANQLGVTKRTARRLDEAMENYHHALSLLKELVRDHPSEDSYQSELAHVLRNLGVLHRATNNLEEAMSNYQQARAAFETLVGRHPSVANYRQGLANSYFNLANLYIDTGRSQEILDSLAAARKVQEGLIHDFPTVGRFQADLARIYGQLGAYLNFQSRQEESLANLEEARKILIGLVRDHPDVVNYRVDLELTNYHIGCRYRFFGRYIQALSTLEEARDFFEKMDRENPNEPNSRHVLAAIWEDIAGVFRATHRDPDAVTAYQQAILHQTRAYEQAISDSRSRGESANHLLSQYEKLAETHLLLNRPTDATDSLSHAIASLKKRPLITPNESYVEARIVCRMIDVLDRDGQKPTAARKMQRGELVKQAVGALRNAFPPGTVSFKGLKDDKHLDSIRCDVEFQVFMMDLAFPAKPFQR